MKCIQNAIQVRRRAHQSLKENEKNESMTSSVQNILGWLNQNFLKERFNWDQYVVWAAVKDSLLFNKKKKQLMGGVGRVLIGFNEIRVEI